MSADSQSVAGLEGSATIIKTNASSITIAHEDFKPQTSKNVIDGATYPAKTEEMLYKVRTCAGVANVGDLTFKLNEEFKAGTYILVCKDMTPGLPPRMQMRHTKILIKFVDLDPPPEEEAKVDAKNNARGGKKK